jgi:hypothetical protein
VRAPALQPIDDTVSALKKDPAVRSATSPLAGRRQSAR